MTNADSILRKESRYSEIQLKPTDAKTLLRINRDKTRHKKFKIAKVKRIFTVRSCVYLLRLTQSCVCVFVCKFFSYLFIHKKQNIKSSINAYKPQPSESNARGMEEGGHDGTSVCNKRVLNVRSL